MSVNHYPPPAIASLNNRDALIAQAEELERFAASEERLETDARARFWRASAALRVAAMVHSDDPGLLAAYATAVDHWRAGK